MSHQVPAQELRARMARFRQAMDAGQPEWELAAVFGRINLYYLTGTVQDSVLVVPRDGEAVLWVRRSYERACAESAFPDIRRMDSYRTAAATGTRVASTLHIEAEVVPWGVLERFRKHFPAREIRGLDAQLARLRSVKSAYELGLMEASGRIHRRVLEDDVPGMLAEGMSEAALATAVYSRMVELGHQGIVRFSAFNVEVEVGQIAFGEGSIRPSPFNGPAGCDGYCPAAPVLGSPDRRLSAGAPVFVDVGCGVDGYQTDKTMLYMFRGEIPDEVVGVHHECVRIQELVASLLRPGAIPSEIYKSVVGGLDARFQENFMGFGSHRAGFLGHGIGLAIDETPVIAPGFDEPLEEGMVFAVEPKKGIAGFGMVGTENTYVVTPAGGRSLTGEATGPIVVQ